MGDAPAVGRSLIPMALPAFGSERLSIGPLRGEYKIVDKPGGIARHQDADVAGLKIPLRVLLQCPCVDLLARRPSPGSGLPSGVTTRTSGLCNQTFEAKG